jgi:hypothetical protein
MQSESTDEKIAELGETSAAYIRDYAYKHGDCIYNFMDQYNIGHSEYGKMMDAVGKTKHVIAHRLYGHHIIYDFPLKTPKNIPAFLEHELSDLFTKMGLPILPGELIENTPLLKYCSKLSNNWNFVNGFDILFGTIAIWQSIEKVSQAFNYEITIDTFDDFAKTFGVGALELAIAISSANPFLLIAASLHLTSGIRALFNDRATILFRKNISTLMIEFSLDSFNIQKYIKMYNISNETIDYSINNKLKVYSFDNKLNEYKLPIY